MSTRCQIEFKTVYKVKQKNGKMKEQEESILLYRHLDGYPEGVVPDLKEFLKWNGGRNSDLEFMTANFIYWSKRHFEENYYHEKYGGGLDDKGKPKKWSDPQDFNSMLLLGFGICEKDCFHGDIEYFYEVIVRLDSGVIDREEKGGGIIIKVYKTDYEKEYKRENFELIATEKFGGGEK